MQISLAALVWALGLTAAGTALITWAACEWTYTREQRRRRERRLRRSPDGWGGPTMALLAPRSIPTNTVAWPSTRSHTRVDVREYDDNVT